MKLILSLILYMIVGGAMAALAINSEAKKCGPVRVDINDYATIVIVWPAFVGTAVVLDKDALKPSKCDDTTHKND